VGHRLPEHRAHHGSGDEPLPAEPGDGQRRAAAGRQRCDGARRPARARGLSRRDGGVSPVPALAIADLVAGYEPDLPIVRGASLAVADGEIVALLGPNGAGKSTLVKAVAGLVAVSGGRVTFAGRDIAGVPAYRLAQQGLAFVPQTDNVFARLGVLENLELAGHRLGRRRQERVAAMLA